VGGVTGPSDADRVAAARFVARHWRDAATGWGDDPFPGRVTAHPLSLVLSALDGETDPAQLGLDEDVHDSFRAAVAEARS
jgi:hypothetical protein